MATEPPPLPKSEGFWCHDCGAFRHQRPYLRLEGSAGDPNKMKRLQICDICWEIYTEGRGYR